VNVEVRAATDADIDAVLAVWAEARSRAAQTPDDPAVVQQLLDRDPGALLVADSDGEVIGVLIAGWDGWRGNVYRLAVLPSHRREGIARELVDAGHERGASPRWWAARRAPRTGSGAHSATSATSSSTVSCATSEWPSLARPRHVTSHKCHDRTIYVGGFPCKGRRSGWRAENRG
jgi:GNAT superfamily N-acetyltransferase